MSSEIYEKIGQLKSTVDALHGRQDRTETLVKEELHKVHSALGELNLYIAKQKMWVDAAKWFGGAFGGVILTTIVKYITTGKLL